MNSPTVAVVDPLWIGHHPMYFGEFGASFIRNGARVIGICPDARAGKKEILQALGRIEERVECFTLPLSRQSFFDGRFESDPLLTYLRWKHAAEAVHAAEAIMGHGVDLVYFPYLDSYLRFLPFPAVPDRLLGRKWSGLYLRYHHLRYSRGILQNLRRLAKGDRLMKSQSCIEIGVLDERHAEDVAQFTGKRVQAFPDVTLTNLPDQDTPLAHEIKRKAAGRKIIGLIGLERRKGAATMLRLARLAGKNNLPWFFVFAGQYDRDQFSSREQEDFAALRKGILNGSIGHVHFDPLAPRIPTEPEYNSLFRTFDIAWAAYHDFPGSSGTLSKAAAFEIPVLATHGECIGSRVEDFQLGATIAQDSHEEAEQAIQRLLFSPPKSNFAAYRQTHSRDCLDKLLGDLLESL